MRLLVATLFMSLAIGCTPPCQSLANRICDCEQATVDQQACRNQVSNDAKGITVTQLENDRCQAIIDSKQCTCNALRTNREACGFTNQ